MRRLIAVLVGLSVAVTPTEAFADDANVVLDRSEFDVDVSGPAALCDFPLMVTAGIEHHRITTQLKGLPDDIAPEDSMGILYVVWGEHWVDGDAVITNPANGRALNYHTTGRLIRRDWDTSEVTFGPNGELNGMLHAVDHFSGSQVAQPADGGGQPALLTAGHQRSFHTSFYLDDERVGRLDIPFFISGTYRLEFCSYLAG